MIRLFETHRIRKTKELDGMWDFAVLSEQSEPLESVNYMYRLAVPGCWEMHPDLATFRGIGMYRKRLETAERTTYRFEFKGVSHSAKVCFDGKPVAEHYNAYTSFSVIVQDVEPGSHELTVLVDNGFHERSSLHIPNDYYTYGGLIRPVVLEEIGKAYIERIAFEPLWENGVWSAHVRAVIRNVTEGKLSIQLHGELAGQQLNFAPAELPSGCDAGLELSGTFSMPGVIPWSGANPQLYELSLQLSAGEERDENSRRIVDDLIERVGFRIVTTSGGKIQINGEDIVLRGFNRHEDHPMVGAAFPLQLMVKDLDLMADMGANSVRTSHYPNDERFLDLCDERGIFVWEENHARGLSLEQMRNPYFASQCEQVNREMVDQHCNHPSIVIWGILNECASDTDEGRTHYKTQIEQIKALDSTRPITFASHHRDKELCFDLADIVSFNLYPGWYGDEDPGELCDLARAWADAAGGAGKPMIMSEFGGDGYYCYRDPSRVKGTEERQADIIEANLAAYTTRSFISGMFIWQFCDCRVTEGTGWLLSRAGTKNSKGIVDAYRRPKLSYAVVKKFFTD
ncbi:glycoside hydrolase family 2 protein [Paenibacillus thalictri]|uniref:Beta-glucuronidase n=1 Tax=Paenibacillus thalictri TaxID=2527873 RepID=A0A4Q9DHI6_9BACL|nr:glycoside hydrolase family 2 TIM barrel-domain containing protein [Paenibacillus thalictri]TBL70333.1 beta-glucuronidase [Paenibacillus thalictri]